MVALPTGRTVVGIVLAATGILVHLHGCPARQMLSTLGAHMYRLSLMHVQVPPENFGRGKILPTKCAVDLILTWLWDSKRHVPSTGRTCRKRCGQFTFEGQFGTPLDATQHRFLMTTSSGPTSQNQLEAHLRDPMCLLKEPGHQLVEWQLCSESKKVIQTFQDEKQ